MLWAFPSHTPCSLSLVEPEMLQAFMEFQRAIPSFVSSAFVVVFAASILCTRHVVQAQATDLSDEAAGGHGASCRSVLVWPYNSSSVWNTALGSASTFVEANLFPSATPPVDGVFVDEDYFLTTIASDPVIPWYSQGFWNSTPHCDLFPWSRFVDNVSWPAGTTITAGGNNALALLLPDGDSLVLTQPAYQCNASAPVLLSLYDARFGRQSIRGVGNWGGHGGSALNAIGGSLRLGELLPNATSPGPLHVLKLQLWAAQYYYGFAHGANWSTCYRWPALVCDGYANDPSLYGGANPHLKPGALLAVPLPALANLTARLETAPARALAWTLAHYGGLLCDDTYADRMTINAEHGFSDAFEGAWGWPFSTSSNDPLSMTWRADVLTLFRALQIVDSNSPASPGGGGSPLAPPPPPLCD